MDAKLCDFCGSRVENGYRFYPPTEFLNNGVLISQRAHDFCDARCVQLWLAQKEEK